MVTEEMLKKFNSSMYEHEANEGDDDNTESDDVELMGEILQE